MGYIQQNMWFIPQIWLHNIEKSLKSLHNYEKTIGFQEKVYIMQKMGYIEKKIFYIPFLLLSKFIYFATNNASRLLCRLLKFLIKYDNMPLKIC